MRNHFSTRIQYVLSSIGTAAIDKGTHEGRGKERDRRVMYTMLASVGARIISLFTILASVRLTVNYLGAERYGLWATMASFIVILGFADLGIGNGLLNAISQCHGRDDRDGARRYVASAFLMLIAVSLLLGIAFVIVYRFIWWAGIFNVSDPRAVAEAGPATAVFFFCFLASIPLTIIQRVQQGYQEGFIDSLWLAAGKVLAFIAVLLVITFKAGLPWLVFAVAGVPVLSTCINGIALFTVRKPYLRPRLRDVNWLEAKRILDLGFLFLVVQLASAIAYSADSLVIARLIGPYAVTQYSVVYQIFSLGPVFLGMFLAPLWPAYGEAIVRGDSQWIRLTLRRSIGIGLALNVPYALLLIIWGNPIIHLWVGNEITAPSVLLVAFGIWTAMNSFNGAIAVFLNGVNAMRFQAVCAFLMACVNLVLSIILTKSIGLSGVIWGSIIAQTILVLIPSAVYISRLMHGFVLPARLKAAEPEARTFG
jgi:O-antigen/teichoic acid export membrane protein